MRKFVFKPDITFYEGIKIDKETKLEFENEYVKQSINNLVLKTNKKEKTDKYESEFNLTINLDEGEILLFEEERGYFLPSLPMSTVKDAIEDLEAIKDFDKEG
jgi:hypothetical protein